MHPKTPDFKVRVRIVCGEPVHQWILGKFALRLEHYLKESGVDVDIDYEPDPAADVNHYIIYIQYKGVETPGITTSMITHIDNSAKLNMLKDQLKKVDMGICMSGDTRNFLIKNGLPANRLSYISPAHDEVIKPRKRVIGITCRVQDDGRKREHLLKDISNVIDSDLFSFKIMGDGWEKYVDLLRSRGFDVEYHNAFIYELYTTLIPSFDYYLYMGMDEGQMGCIDALAAGVECIVTRQGYHLDMLDGIRYTFVTKEELLGVFEEIQAELKKKIDTVKFWTWPYYAQKHLEMWEYLVAQSKGENAQVIDRGYSDGVLSITDKIEEGDTAALDKMRSGAALKANYVAHTYHSKKKQFASWIKTKGIAGTVKHIWEKSIEKIFK